MDVDNDGWLDLFVARPRNRSDLLLRNRRERDVRRRRRGGGGNGPGTGEPRYPRRAIPAWGDLESDGRVDLIVATVITHDRPENFIRLYLNRSEPQNHWVTLRLRDPGSLNREAWGAKVWITAGGRTQYRDLTAPTARWSQSPPYLMLGLGSSTRVDQLRIRWPGDQQEIVYAGFPTDRHYVVTKGVGVDPGITRGTCPHSPRGNRPAGGHWLRPFRSPLTRSALPCAGDATFATWPRR